MNPENNGTERSRCRLCSSEHVSPLVKGQAYEIHRCRQCGFVYRWPPVNKSQYLEDLNRHYSKVDPAQEVARSRRKMYQEFLRRIRPLKNGGCRLLDVGSGLGYFLALAKDGGWDVWGLEANPELADEGSRKHGTKIQYADFEEAQLPSGYFDVVTLWNVLEELPDPLASIRKIRDVLKPSGVLFVRTPNLDFHFFLFRWQKRLAKAKLGSILPQQSSLFHIANYSAKTLKRILRDHGFSNIRIGNSSPTSGDPYGVKKGAPFLKKIAYLSAQSLSFLSFRRLTLGPSIEVWAENGKN